MTEHEELRIAFWCLLALLLGTPLVAAFFLDFMALASGGSCR